MTPQIHNELSETETFDSDDSQEDPSFDMLEETRSKLSNLSINKKSISRSRVSVKRDEDADCDDCVERETAGTEFDASDEKSFEIVQKIIEGCQVEKLKVEQCKVYLRKYGLRLTGKKDILIQRIKEHISVMNGEGEHKYPASSFVMNCKGDACTGDVVMFEQNVYEMFNIASRSASGPPCGQRIVAGRIVKESYGAAKQQHTFTVEVLWSKGHKPLPPLHPLLIKGRNLYKLKTMRQRWEDETERQKILSEKHARGNAARTNRDARLHKKEIKKALRASKGDFKNEKQEMKRKQSPTHPIPILNPRTSIQHTSVSLGHNKNHGPPSTENMNPNNLINPLRNRFEDSRSFQRDDYGPLQQVINNGYSSNNGYLPMGHYQKHHGASSRLVIRQDYGDAQNGYGFHKVVNNGCLPRDHCQGKRQQLCRYYAQGRCHYGTNCKYLH